jgi:periplasmic divalent cation tolerance protein
MHTCVILTTASSEVEAKKIAHQLVESKCAACVNIIPKIVSVYFWNGSICEDEEYLLFIKTQKACFDDVKDVILKLHSYELPEIIMLPIETGFEKYISWIEKETKK